MTPIINPVHNPSSLKPAIKARRLPRGIAQRYIVTKEIIAAIPYLPSPLITPPSVPA